MLISMTALLSGTSGSVDLPGTRPPVLDVVVPVYNEETDLEPCVRRLHAHLLGALPVLRSGSPSPTTPAPTARSRSPRGWPTSCPTSRCVRLDEKGRGRALRDGVAALGRRRSSPTWTSTSPPTWPRCCPLVAPLISGHSDLAIGTRLARGVPGGPRPEAGVHLPLLQPAAARHAGRRASPTPSAASRRSGPTSPGGCCRWSRTPAGSSTPSCWCWPSAPACASTRCRSTGSTTPTAASTSSRPPVADLRGHRAAAAARFATGALPVAELRAQLGRQPLAPPGAGSAAGLVSQLVRFAVDRRAVSTLAYLCSSCCSAHAIGAQAANLVALLLTAVANTAANRRFTFGIRGGVGAAPAPAAGPGRLRPRAGADQRLARRPARRHGDRPRGRRSSRCSSPPTSPPPLLRFVLFRGWVFRPRTTSAHDGGPVGHGRWRPPMTAALPTTARDRFRRPPAPPPFRLRRLVRGREGDARWVRPALLALLVGTGVLYLWDLAASGWANAFYAAAVAGRHGELEGVLLRLARRRQLDHRRQAAGLAVGDGPVGADLRALVVDACSSRRRSMGVATGRPALPAPSAGSPGRPPGLLAGGGLALTPVAVLMFRFNNPDALLVLLLTLAAYALTRAPPRRRSGRWLVAGRRPGRARVPDQDAAGARSSCPRSRWSTWSPRRRPCAGGCGTCWRARRWRSSCPAGLVGRRRRADAGVARGPTSAARRPTASWS